MEIEEWDDLDAAYAQHDNEERRHWEERILARGKQVYDEFQKTVKEIKRAQSQ